MVLTRSERFRLLSRIADEVVENSSMWDQAAQNRLLRSFGFESLAPGGDGPTLDQVIVYAADGDLVEMVKLVTGDDATSVEETAQAQDLTGWTPGRLRLFVSHSAAHREFVGQVATELDSWGIHGFVAHDTMQYSMPWQAQIEQALRTMQAFVVIVHPEVNSSPWCQQEIGWALGRGVPTYAVRMGEVPAGFVGRDQWPSDLMESPSAVARTITTWISSLAGLGDEITGGLFSALAAASSYIDAGHAAKGIAGLGALTDSQWQRLDAIIVENDQVRGGALPRRELEPFYREHRREWPIQATP